MTPWARCALVVVALTAVARADPGLAGLAVRGGRLTVEVEGQSKFLRVTAPPGDAAPHLEVRFTVARERGLEGVAALRARLRLPAGARARWFALGPDRRPLLQRRLPDEVREGWFEVHEPLHLWRWADDRVGDVAAVTTIALVVEGAAQVDLDDERLEAGAPSRGWLDALAFGEAPPRVVDAGAFRLALDASLAAGDEEVARAVLRLAAIPRWLERVAGDAWRPPAPDEPPIPVLVLRDRAAYEAFFVRLGEAWRVTISPPGADGYTVQDVCALAHVPGRPLDRPVLLHEATHALVARRLGLVAGSARHGWLQEGLANALQLAVFPDAFRGRWGALLARGALPPLEGRPPLERYPHLAALTAWLLAERPDWLRALCRGLAAGEATSDALARLGTTPAEVEAAWLAWARARWPGGEAPEPPLMAPPPEFAR